MFKFHINFDSHNAGLKFNYCLRFDPPNFSLPSTCKYKWQQQKKGDFNLRSKTTGIILFFHVDTTWPSPLTHLVFFHKSDECRSLHLDRLARSEHRKFLFPLSFVVEARMCANLGAVLQNRLSVSGIIIKDKKQMQHAVWRYCFNGKRGGRSLPWKCLVGKFSFSILNGFHHERSMNRS